MKVSRWTIAKAKKRALGRLLCRLFGDEAGGVMMEYVILAVLVAAAVVVAVMVFGKTIMEMFGVATKAGAGEHSQASADRQKIGGQVATEVQKGATHHSKMHK